MCNIFGYVLYVSVKQTVYDFFVWLFLEYDIKMGTARSETKMETSVALTDSSNQQWFI